MELKEKMHKDNLRIKTEYLKLKKREIDLLKKRYEAKMHFDRLKLKMKVEKYKVKYPKIDWSKFEL